MYFLKKYKCFTMTLLMIATIAGTYFATNIPANGSRSSNASEQAVLRFGYILAKEKTDPVNLQEWMNRNKTVPFIAGADRLFDKKSAVPLSGFYPVFDGSSSLEAFNASYPNLPPDAVANYGRSIYTIDYVNTRFLFLHDQAVSEPDLTGLNWIQQTVVTNKQTHAVIFINKAPEFPSFWETMRKLNINFVVTEDEVYAPRHLIVQEPSEFNPAVYPGWNVWRPALQFPNAKALIMEGSGYRLNMKVEDDQGHSLDQLEEDTAQLELKSKANAGTLVGIQSVWRYHAGGDQIKSAIPEGYDISGENPITERLTLPSDDWRSPGYDDSGWSLGQAPLGHSNNEVVKRLIQAALPVAAESPTYYFRKSFVLEEDPSVFKQLLLQITYEDGYVVYLNGEEVSRDGIRTGLLDHASLAFPGEPAIYHTKSITNHIPKLVKGTNMIAVEVHRSHPKSPNLLFDLSLAYQK